MEVKTAIALGRLLGDLADLKRMLAEDAYTVGYLIAKLDVAVGRAEQTAGLKPTTTATTKEG